MATKAISLRLEDSQILDAKKVSEVFRISFTDVIRSALDEYLQKMKSDPLYRLTANVESVSDEENEELSAMIDSLTADDLEIARTEVIKI